MIFIDQEISTAPNIAKLTPLQSNTTVTRQQLVGTGKQLSVLCILDDILGNLIIHYSKTRVLHPRQGIDDILEVVREENLLDNGIKLVYLLAGRPDKSLPPVNFGHNVEKLLDGMAKIIPRIMVVLGAVIINPGDDWETKCNIVDLNSKLARIAEGDHHWLFFNANTSISVAGDPQKRFFDKLGRVNKAGCRFIAQGLVGSSKAARMLQNFSSLPPKTVK